jgi:hypothetical protein
MDDHDLVPMVTWGSTILRTPHRHQGKALADNKNIIECLKIFMVKPCEPPIFAGGGTSEETSIFCIQKKMLKIPWSFPLN